MTYYNHNYNYMPCNMISICQYCISFKQIHKLQMLLANPEDVKEGNTKVVRTGHTLRTSAADIAARVVSPSKPGADQSVQRHPCEGSGVIGSAGQSYAISWMKHKT